MREEAAPRPGSGWAAGTDDELALIFTCCHPALDPAARVRADAALRVRADHGRDRGRIPGSRAGHGAAPGTGQAQDPPGRHRVPGAGAGGPARPAQRGAAGGVPGLHRGAPGRGR